MEKLQKILEPIAILLRGIGQVVFQGNALSGLVIWIGLFVASWVAGIATLVGVAVSTLTAVLLKVDKDLIAAGLMGFNGVLTAIAVAMYNSDIVGNLAPGYVWSLVVVGSAFSTVVMLALSRLLSPWSLPALTMPFIVCGWIFVGQVEFTARLEDPALARLAPQLFDPAMVAREEAWQYTLETLYIGVGKGFSEIFLQDSAIGGYLILAGIAINSRISALMGLMAALVSIMAAMMFGLTEQSIQMGLHSYNAILTAIAVGGFFLLISVGSILYTLFCVFITVWVGLSVGFALAHLGFPVYTFPFVIVTWAALLGAMNTGNLKYILPAEATTAEGNFQRFSAAVRKRAQSSLPQTGGEHEQA
jgi:urea transporter